MVTKCETHDSATWLRGCLLDSYQRLVGVCFPDFYPEERGNRFNRNYGTNITEMHGVASAGNIVHAALSSKVLPSRREMTSLFRPTKRGTHFFVACQTYADIWWNKLEACTAGVLFLLSSWLCIYLLCDPLNIPSDCSLSELTHAQAPTVHAYASCRMWCRVVH